MNVRRIVLLLALCLALAGLCAGGVLLWQPRWLIQALAEGAPRVLYRAQTAERLVALTIDDGPHPETTPAILDVLRPHDARATFFLISERVQGREALVERLVRAGHELGNHLTRDRPSVRLSPDEFERALLEADSVLSRFAPVRWLRPAGGRYSDTLVDIAAEHGYRVALGSIYPYDAQLPFPSFAAMLIRRHARAGAVIVLHDGPERGRRTAEVLERVLPELRRRGLRVVTLSELVAASDGSRGPGSAGQ